MSDYQKQTVQWFPGHMAKTRRLMKESMPLVDAVCELVDARVPSASRNPELEELIGSKPHIMLLNKCDVANESATRQWTEFYQAQGIFVLPVDCRSGKGVSRFVPLVQTVLADKIQSNLDRGMAGRALRIMVVGIPNTGKSSFINRMAGKSRAKVADKPGVTRHNQWFTIGKGIELLDTPGVLWPKFDDPVVGDRLAFTGAVKDEVMDIESLAMKLLDTLVVVEPACLAERYKLADYGQLDGYDLLEAIGRKRGFLGSGGTVNLERTAVTVVDEFRAGKLGRITLE